MVKRGRAEHKILSPHHHSKKNAQSYLSPPESAGKKDGTT